MSFAAALHSISEVYSVHEQFAELFENKIARYDSTSVIWENQLEIWSRRSNLNGIKIRMTATDTQPGLYVPKGRPELSVGFQIDIIKVEFCAIHNLVQ